MNTLVIILNWNGATDTRECLASLRRSEGVRFDVLVVDNGSRRDDVEELRAAIVDETLVELPENLGFAGGVNYGLRFGLERSYSCFLLLNNDLVVDSECISQLLEAAYSQACIGIAGAVNYYADEPDRVWYSGGYVNWATGQLSDPTAEKCDLSAFPLIRDVDDVAGSSLLVKREVIEKIGLLEPKYFAYYEETDWCVRAKRAGYRVVACRDAKAWHKVSRTLPSTGTHYLMTRNRCLFMLRNASIIQLAPFLGREARRALSLGLRRRHLDEKEVASLTAYVDVARRLWGKGRLDQFLHR